MEFLFEILLQFFGELLLQVIFEALAELGVHSLSNTLKQPRSAVLSSIGFVLWGTIAGGLSLLIAPKSLISDVAFRQVNLILTPLLAGAIMMWIGRQRDKRGQVLVRLDRFGYAFIFAFAMALVRYLWAA